MTGAFVDANVPVYAFGREHPLRAPCRDILREFTRGPSACWSSAEVLQELLNIGVRRRAEDRISETIRNLASSLGNQLVPVDAEHILWCLSQDWPPGLQSRDRVHVAVMDRLGITQIISADRGFDDVRGINRLDPLHFDQWRSEVFDA